MYTIKYYVRNTFCFAITLILLNRSSITSILQQLHTYATIVPSNSCSSLYTRAIAGAYHNFFQRCVLVNKLFLGYAEFFKSCDWGGQAPGRLTWRDEDYNWVNLGGNILYSIIGANSAWCSRCVHRSRTIHACMYTVCMECWHSLNDSVIFSTRRDLCGS